MPPILTDARDLCGHREGEAACALPGSILSGAQWASVPRVCSVCSLLRGVLSASWHLQREVSALALLDAN